MYQWVSINGLKIYVLWNKLQRILPLKVSHYGEVDKYLMHGHLINIEHTDPSPFITLYSAFKFSSSEENKLAWIACFRFFTSAKGNKNIRHNNNENIWNSLYYRYYLNLTVQLYS